MHTTWEKWVAQETRRRAIQLLDSLALIFCNLQPVFQANQLPMIEPCADNLWRSHTAEAWSTEMAEATAKPRGCSVQSRAPQNFDGFSSSFALVVACMQERQLLISLVGPNNHLEAFAIESSLGGAHLRSFGSSLAQSFADTKLRRLNDEIESLTERFISFDAGGRGEVEGRNKVASLLFHTASIFRHVSFQALLRLSGWHSSTAEMENATGELEGWVLRNPGSSRKCLSHAAAIFAQLRSTRHLACIDRLALISAVIYVRLYDLSRTRAPINLAGLSSLLSHTWE
ncbi:hypothetical protein BDP55DRAFT_742717 [Colletotrichum godetiae]|uniref:Uncharacterized protein n=1 Tax=Colletotrichum godetiae TaxID=1209918 RepID=A0AAJ0AMG5_9PEZI|nr:uncharacterized protein BDP55DRAFT_742717 [Colletotrichum godetiae]KAK1675959.1 hypothetical protein BDP55DRAFT_742717 [Colletotrichum godetiae]